LNNRFVGLAGFPEKARHGPPKIVCLKRVSVYVPVKNPLPSGE